MRVVMSVVIGLLVLTSAAFANEGFEEWGTPWYDMVIDSNAGADYYYGGSGYERSSSSGCGGSWSMSSCGSTSSCGYSYGSWSGGDDPGWDWGYE